MSESSSDTESSCGWTVISNEGSDIETLGVDISVDYDPREAAGVSVKEQTASSAAEDAEVVERYSLDVTIKEGEETVLEAKLGEQAGERAGLEYHAHLCSASDHSDIITLGDTKEAELLVAWEDPGVREDEDTGTQELYMGTSSSSQYTFSSAETIFPAERSTRRDSNSTSTEDEDGETKASVGMPTVRRRRLRRNTIGSDPEEPTERVEDRDDGQDELVEEAEEQIEAHVQHQRPSSGTLNKCVLLALVIAISMGFGHFYGTVQSQERQRLVEKIRANELSDIINKDVVESLKDEEKQYLVMSLSAIMDKMTKDNRELRAREAELQAQKQDLLTQLQQAKSEMVSSEKHLASENQALKSTLEQEEALLSSLQDEFWQLRAQIHDLEEKGSGADSVLSENQHLKDHLLEEKQRTQSYLSQKEALIAEAQVLRKELDKERKVTDKLREELEELSQHGTGMQAEETESEELQTRLREMERKLSFEQQRSDLWERLYVESKENLNQPQRAKGDTQPKPRKSKEGMLGKVKETFDAVRNSTKEFVHHHKEQLKKAKEAVKENIRRFSDSVKSTFKHLKDSTSNAFQRRPQDRTFNEDRKGKPKQQEGFNEQKYKSSEEERWQHRRPLHQHPHKSTADDRNMRKPGAQKQQRTAGCKSVPKGCTGVFDCAYQESMSLFNKAMEPIRADEFHQLLHSYLQQEVGHFNHWRELDSFINRFFQNGLFIHDQMLFTDFVSGVEDYLVDMEEYQDEEVFEDLDDYIYKHFFGKTYSEQNYPRSETRRPFEGPGSKVKSKPECQRQQKHRHEQQRKHQHSRSLPSRDRKWSRSGRSPDRHFADVKIELGPMPFDPKY